MAWRVPVLTPLLGHCQGQQFPALLTDPTLSGQGATGSPQVILVSHTSQAPSATCEEITYQVPGDGVQETVAPTSFLPGAVLVVVSPAPNPVFHMASASHRGFRKQWTKGWGGAGPTPCIYIHSPSGPQVTDVAASLGPGGSAEKECRLQPCSECGRSFPSAALLQQHSKEAHGRERIHVCALCHKAFKRATHLKVCAGSRVFEEWGGAYRSSSK